MIDICLLLCRDLPNTNQMMLSLGIWNQYAAESLTHFTRPLDYMGCYLQSPAEAPKYTERDPFTSSKCTIAAVSFYGFFFIAQLISAKKKISGCWVAVSEGSIMFKVN